MAWLYILSILMLVQVMRSESVSDSVTVNFQLNTYKYSGDNFMCRSPIFLILVDEGNGVCEEEYEYVVDRDFKKFNNSSPSENTTTSSSLLLQYQFRQMNFSLPRQEYRKTLRIAVKQKYNNTNVVTGEDDLTHYCSNVSTDKLVSPFNLPIQCQPHKQCSSCSIDVTLVATCPQHYFGAQCDIYCSPSDNTTGHYTCGHEGEKNCLLGYEGVNCTVNTPDCVNVTCHNGTCIDLVANFSCSCYTGYTGEFCEDNIDDCVNATCQNGGLCLDGIGTYNCYCGNGFDGLHCENNTDDCVNATCKNGGSCLDGIGNYTCSCVNGFNGFHCENNTDDCVNITCQNGGTCRDGIGKYTCICNAGFGGIYCQQYVTTQSPTVTSPPKSTINKEQPSTTQRPPGTLKPKSTSILPSTQRSSVTLPPESSISNEHTSSTHRSTVSLPPESTINREQSSPTHRPPVTQPPESTSNLEQTLSTPSQPIKISPKLIREHPSSTKRTLPPKIDNESSPQKAVKIAPIAGGATGGVIVLVIVVVLVIKCRRRQPQQASQKDQSLMKNTNISYNSTNEVDLHIKGHQNSVDHQDGQFGAEKDKRHDNPIYHEDEQTQL